MMHIKQLIDNGEAILGIELGSTRIKSVLIDPCGAILEKGGFDWENHLIGGIWTYALDEVWQGLQKSYSNLAKNVYEKYGATIQRVAAIGISGMMHGYIPFDKEGNQLVPFRTWRNNITGEAAKKLTDMFNYNIPQRWSVAHLYQAILNKESHVTEIDYITTLAGYVHWKLTGNKVIGIGEASGMFPIDIEKKDFNMAMIDLFDSDIVYKNYPWKLKNILPKVLVAGQSAGRLTKEGAALLDTSGNLQEGIELCPPEGDAGTGMVATNSVREKTGNVSAGTSAFAMVVLEQELSKVYENLDMVTTPSGKLVAMAHSNNCTTDINAWVGLFGECLKSFDVPYDNQKLYETLFLKAMEGAPDCGKLLSYCFYSGEHGVELTEGYPIFLHSADAEFNLSNFMRVHLYSAFGAMKLGMDTLMKKENVKIEKILGHGGIFKTQGVAQSILASALDVPVAVMETAGEGGAWGIAILAAFMKRYGNGECLEDFLENTVFKNYNITTISPEETLVHGYEAFIEQYKKNLNVVREAVTVQKQ